MTKVATIAIAALAALTFAVPPGAASHCATASTSDALLEYGSFYIVTDLLGGVLIYEESNGKDGLQRGDASVDNTCHGRVKADTRVF
ncbi:MAG TPA: hypothetical protein VFH78_11940 [Candidatus Thermoplasmatota archaeon]|nr:hypothetical protein [Candidatus Thermoplasmatota archaeon]